MTAPSKTTITCPVCTHHVQVVGGKVAFHRIAGRDCDGMGQQVNGFKVTVVDLATGESSDRYVEAGEYVLVTGPPCYLDGIQQWTKSGTVQLTIKNHRDLWFLVVEAWKFFYVHMFGVLILAVSTTFVTVLTFSFVIAGLQVTAVFVMLVGVLGIAVGVAVKAMGGGKS